MLLSFAFVSLGWQLCLLCGCIVLQTCCLVELSLPDRNIIEAGPTESISNAFEELFKKKIAFWQEFMCLCCERDGLAGADRLSTLP